MVLIGNAGLICSQPVLLLQNVDIILWAMYGDLPTRVFKVTKINSVRPLTDSEAGRTIK